ncbi:MAG: hypothetical protein JWL82_68 [Parcubacteria group bacterium]|nr:hypothetical protein [Parcubacteria group bacterium]
MIRFHIITLFPEACDAYLNALVLDATEGL